MAKVHEYPVSLEWSGGRDGSGRVKTDRTGVSLPLVVPPEFGGSAGGGSNPEELLTASLCACYSITFGIIAENRKVPVAGLNVSATGEVEENGPQFTFKQVTLRPTIRLAADATDEQVKIAEDMAHKADAYCIVTNAVRDRVKIVVEPSVTRG